MTIRIDPEADVMQEMETALTWRNFTDRVDPDRRLSDAERERQAIVARRVFLLRMVLRRATIRVRQEELNALLSAYQAELQAVGLP